ncbi:MAG: adenylate/guanylate cyclase domain-containing protein [Bryobacteraceae bacterium]|jgi:class 3 adenylate cyclase
MEIGFLISLIGAAVWFNVLLIAARKRWFSHLKGGFRLTLSISLISIAVWASFLISYWGYNSARKSLYKDTDANLQNLAEVVEETVNASIMDAEEEARPAAEALAGRVDRELESGAPHISRDLRHELHHFNPHFLEARIVKGGIDPDAGIHPRYDEEFHEYVIDIKTPLLRPGHAPETFVVAYDIERDLNALVDKIPIGKTGSVIVVNDDGRVMAHRDKSRIHEDVSRYEAVKRVRAGARENAPLEEAKKNGDMRLFAYRPVLLPHDRSPLIVVAEMDAAEVEAPIRLLLLEFCSGFAILAVVAVLLGTQISSYVHRPIEALLGMIERVKQGDLTAAAADMGKDEIGQLGAALNEMARALNDRDRIKEIFGRYVTTQVSEEVLKGHVNLGGHSRRVTMLISDIRGFTAMSEQMQPEEVVKFLNVYFSGMVDAVFEYGGVLDKFLGDGLLAVFGSFTEQPDHPWRAVSTALRMQATLAKMNEQRAAAGMAAIRIGIGIHTGEVVVGNIGSQKRLEYTVIGDGVNTTSRLQTLNKEFSTMILISETTYEAVKDRVECRLMPDSVLRGKTKPLKFYEVTGVKGSVSNDTAAREAAARVASVSETAT